MIETVETTRLRGERIAPAHHAEMLALLGDPRVGATLGGTLSAEELSGSLAAKDAHWERHGFGYWLWREKATGACIGRGGLQWTFVGGLDEVEIGWAVMADRWGEGFATELGRASARVAFERLELTDVVAYTLVDNGPSRRVMDKLGFVYERDVEHAGLPHVLYRLTR